MSGHNRHRRRGRPTQRRPILFTGRKAMDYWNLMKEKAARDAGLSPDGGISTPTPRPLPIYWHNELTSYALVSELSLDCCIKLAKRLNAVWTIIYNQQRPQAFKISATEHVDWHLFGERRQAASNYMLHLPLPRFVYWLEGLGELSVGDRFDDALRRMRWCDIVDEISQVVPPRLTYADRCMNNNLIGNLYGGGLGRRFKQDTATPSDPRHLSDKVTQAMLDADQASTIIPSGLDGLVFDDGMDAEELVNVVDTNPLRDEVTPPSEYAPKPNAPKPETSSELPPPMPEASSITRDQNRVLDNLFGEGGLLSSGRRRSTDEGDPVTPTVSGKQINNVGHTDRTADTKTVAPDTKHEPNDCQNGGESS